jgi:hypothetical protein
MTTHIKEKKTINQITEWLLAGRKHLPCQIMDAKTAESLGFDFWRKRSPGKLTTNINWLKSEQERLSDKGIETKIEKKMIRGEHMVSLFKRPALRG